MTQEAQAFALLAAEADLRTVILAATIAVGYKVNSERTVRGRR